TRGLLPKRRERRHDGLVAAHCVRHASFPATTRLAHAPHNAAQPLARRAQNGSHYSTFSTKILERTRRLAYDSSPTDCGHPHGPRRRHFHGTDTPASQSVHRPPPPPHPRPAPPRPARAAPPAPPLRPPSRRAPRP